jgi:hypothetical protein
LKWEEEAEAGRLVEKKQLFLCFTNKIKIKRGNQESFSLKKKQIEVFYLIFELLFFLIFFVPNECNGPYGMLRNTV